MAVGRLIYSVIASLDGYVEDEGGRFDWATPSDEVHAVNEIERGVGTYLYGRGMYETMVAWETMDTGPEQAAVIREYAELWRAAEKVVFSSSLPEVAGARTRLERSFDPAEIREMKAAVTDNLSIGGPTLAASAFEANLVDVPPLPAPGRRRRRQAGPAWGRPPRARAAGRAPLHRRRCSPPLRAPQMTDERQQPRRKRQQP
jgi:dihydrofolate reductase